jgi:hypothetical protein
MLTEIALLLSSPEQYVCCYRDGEISKPPQSLPSRDRGEAPNQTSRAHATDRD